MSEEKKEKSYFTGNLGTDPVVRDTKSNEKLTTVQIAFGPKEETKWQTITAFGEMQKKLSELKKGQKITVAGEIVPTHYMKGDKKIEANYLKVENIALHQKEEFKGNLLDKPELKKSEASQKEYMTFTVVKNEGDNKQYIDVHVFNKEQIEACKSLEKGAFVEMKADVKTYTFKTENGEKIGYEAVPLELKIVKEKGKDQNTEQAVETPKEVATEAKKTASKKSKLEK